MKTLLIQVNSDLRTFSPDNQEDVFEFVLKVQKETLVPSDTGFDLGEIINPTSSLALTKASWRQDPGMLFNRL